MGGKEKCKLKFDTFSSIINLESNEVTRENANINSDTPAGMMMKFASESSKELTRKYLLSDDVNDAITNNLIHIHDLDYYPTKSTTCVQHPLDKVLEHGFQASDGTARPCKRIETAGALAAIAMQTVQNEQHGGQAIPAFDFYMAPYVRTTYEEELEKICEDTGDDFNELVEMPVDEYEITSCEHPRCVAINRTVKRVHQAMEAFIHNMNTMRSRGGGQTVFSSINYGTDTSPEGRCIIRELLKSTIEGVGNGQTAIFPIQIWKLKEGVSAVEGDPNYDLLQLACECTAKRFFPNYINLDAPFNKHDKWNIDDPKRYLYEPATMGCRTRVFENRHGEKSSIGRGNLSFTTINLPGLALRSKNYAEFLVKLEETVDLVVKQLIDRMNFQSSAYKKQFPMLMNGVWECSDKTDTKYVGDLLKQGTLSVGFIGLAECLKVLFGHHHGEGHSYWAKGYDIVNEITERCKHWANETNLNIGVIATPAEGLSGKFVIKDREKFGVIDGVTDKEHYTNSNHIPVDFPISIENKLKLEAPFHQLTLAGHISYIELDGNPEQNPQAIMDIVRLIRKYDIGYGSVNFARARCLDCGYEDGSSKFDTCPKCSSDNVDVLERITGNSD